MKNKRKNNAPPSAYNQFADQAADVDKLVAAAAGGNQEALAALPAAVLALTAALSVLEEMTRNAGLGLYLQASAEFSDGLNLYAQVCERASLAFRLASMDLPAARAAAEARRIGGRLLRDLEQDEGPDVWHGDGNELEARARQARLLDNQSRTDVGHYVRMRGLWRIFAGDDFDLDGRALILHDHQNHLAEMLAALAADFAGRCGEAQAQWLLGHLIQLIRHLRAPDVFAGPPEDLDIWPAYSEWKAANATAQPWED